MSFFQNLHYFFTNIGTKVSNWFQKEQPVVQKAYSDANNVVNIVKSLLGSATGQTVQLIIEALAPGASVPVFTALNTFFNAWGIVSAEANKPAAEIAAEGFNKIASMTGDNKTVTLHSVTAVLGHALQSHGGGDATLQQALTAIGLVHNPNILDGPVTITTPVVDQSQQATNFVQSGSGEAPEEQNPPS